MVEKHQIAIIVFGAVLLIAFILNTVGVFTSSWIVSSKKITIGTLGNINALGIVPYRKVITGELPWFGVASILMYLTIPLYIFTVAIFGLISFLVVKNGFDSNLRRFIDLIAAFSLTIFLFTVVSVIIIGTGLTPFKNLTLGLSLTISLGYSAWLSLVASIILIAVVIPFFCFSYKNDFPWFGVASVLIYLTIVFHAFILILYGLIIIRIYKTGFSSSLRIWIDLFSAFVLIIFCFTFIAITVIGADLSILNKSLPPASFRLGYSVWLCISASVLLVFVMIPSYYFARRRIREHHKFVF